jgi:hypothetical protein
LNWSPDPLSSERCRVTRRKHRLVWTVVVVVVALGAGFNVERLERVYIAARVYRAHVFTPPPPVAGESPLRRAWYDAEFYWDFSEIPIARLKRLKALNPELRPLIQEIDRRQAAGEGMEYSMHIYREIRWLLNFTPRVKETRAKIEELRRSLNEPEMQKLATQQQSSDGSWGLGIDSWYLRLYYSVDEGVSGGSAPQYPLKFLDRVNSPEKLTAQLDSALYDDFTKTGEFKREELDETFSAVARLLFKSKGPQPYTLDPGLKDALRAFVAKWQNPATGCFGQWMVDRHGRVWKMDDTGMTFHVVSDLHGQVNRLDAITNRLLQLEGLNYPAGPRMNGHYENHLNWDMVIVFRYAWPTLDEPTRAQVRAEISRMLGWCLENSLQPDGSFKTSDLDDTVGDAYYYGVSFLHDSGFFSPRDRFWTTQDFPQAQAIRQRIQAKLQSIGLSDGKIKDAYQTLNEP